MASDHKTPKVKSTRQKRTRRVLNVKFLAGLIVLTLVLGGSLHFVHGAQVKRNSSSFKVRAETALSQKKLSEAVKYLQRYLVFNPTDIESLIKLADALEAISTAPRQQVRVYFALDKVIRMEPARNDVRRRLATIAMLIGRFSDAHEHLELLLTSSPDDPELQHQMARCCEMRGDYRAADGWYKKAIDNAPTQIESYVGLAYLRRRHLNRTADEVEPFLRDMVGKNNESFSAYLAHARYHRDFGSTADEDTLQTISNDVQKARELAPDELDVLLAAADLSLVKASLAQSKRDLDTAASERDQARQLLKRSIELYSEKPQPYQAIVALERALGQSENALEYVQRGLATLSEETSPPAFAALQWILADLLIDRDDLGEANRLIAELQKSSTASLATLTYLEARVSFKKREWNKAATKLEEVRPLLERTPDLLKQAELMLGRCYGRLLDYDRQLAAYRRASKVDPLWVLPSLEAAVALEEQGRLNEALAAYQKLLKIGEVRVRVARLLLSRARRAKEVEPDWAEVEKAIDEAEAVVPDSLEIPLLRAEVLIARNQLDAARKLLTDQLDNHPDHVLFWVALAEVEGLTDPSRVFGIFQQAENRLGDRVELRLARAAYWARQGGDDAKLHLAKLAESIAGFASEDEARLLRGLAVAHLQINDTLGSLRLWRQLAESQSDNLHASVAWFDLATQAEDEQEMEAALEYIRKIEGDAGPLSSFARASRLVRRAPKAGGEQRLAEARSLLVRLAGRRPNWPAVPRLLAQIDELEAHRSDAVEHYQRAVQLGERTPAVLRRLVELLYLQQRYAEANQVIQTLENQAGLPDDLQIVASALSAQVNDLDRAIALAQQSVQAHPENYRNHLWLGQLLSVTGQRQKQRGQAEESAASMQGAERALRDAVKLGDAVPDAWISLVGFLAANGEKEQAAAIIEQARLKLSADSAPLALAQCYEIIGDKDRAEEQYNAAIDAQPDNAAILRSIATFYLRFGLSQKAELPLQRLLEPASKATEAERTWARRALAVALATRGDRDESLKLIEQNLQAGRTPEDLRTKANIAAQSSSRRLRQQAISALEELITRHTPGAQDRYLLAELYEADGDRAKARAQMRDLVASNEPSPVYVAGYVRKLIRDGIIADAEVWVSRLEKVEPQSFRTVTTKARLLGAKGNKKEAAQLVKSYIERADIEPGARTLNEAWQLLTDNKLEDAVQLLDMHVQGGDDEPTGLVLSKCRQLIAQNATEEASRVLKAYLQNLGAEAGIAILRVRTAATLLEEIGEASGAEEMYRKFVALSQKAETMLVLVTFLARQGRIDDALDLCEKAWERCAPASVAAASVAVLRGATPNSQQIARVEGWLQSAVQKNASEPSLLLALADLRDRQGRFEEAEAIYRQILGLDNRNAVALNNLAWLLAKKGAKGGAEAVVLINTAIDIAGLAAELRDTRASAYAAIGQYDKAALEFMEAIDVTPVASKAIASRYFRLADACLRAQSRDSSSKTPRPAEALAQANKAGLSIDKLHPLERKAYEELVAKMDRL
jgi:tetratricopeptide (TPR) repeat protein